MLLIALALVLVTAWLEIRWYRFEAGIAWQYADKYRNAFWDVCMKGQETTLTTTGYSQPDSQPHSTRGSEP